MAHEFHWTIPEIYRVNIRSMDRLIIENNEYIKRQEKESKRGSKGSGRISVDSIDQLASLPSVKRVKKK